jgi:predicted N-acetyltransferase YhbS
MSSLPIAIQGETPTHQLAIADLHALVFGPGRFARTAYRVRGRDGHDVDLSFVAAIDGRVVGAIWQTRALVGGTKAVLLGPLCVRPELNGKGFGTALLAAAIRAARSTEAAAIILVGDEPYYARVGFARVPHGRIGWPGPVDPARVLSLDLEEGATARLSGMIRAARWGAPAEASAALAVPGQPHAAE